MQLALTDPQEQFVFSEAAHPALVAGLGSGKTEAAICRLLIRMVQQPGIDTAFYLPTYDLIKLRAMPGTEERLAQLGIRYTTNRSDYAIKVHGYGSIIFRSYDRPERIVSYEVADSIVDELDTLPKEKAAYVWRKVSERNRQHCGRANTIGSVTTPDQGYSGFTYEKWVKKKQKGYELIKASTASNPFLPDGYIEQIRANYDPILADMYLNGEFVSLSQNKVYHFFERTKHHSDRVLTEADKFIHIGLDFNIGGTCATVWVIDDNKPIAVDEFVSHDTRDFCNNLVKYELDGRKITVYPDASGKAGSTNATQSDIDIIRQAGYSVDAPNANPAIRDRINSVNGLLSHGKMSVNTQNCPNLTDALESQGYTAKGDPEKFNEHPAIDDWCFSGDTEIIVNGKQARFDCAPQSGWVTGADGSQIKYWNLNSKGCDKLLRLHMADGKIIQSTPDHLFLTLDGWVRADDLTGRQLCTSQSLQKIHKYLTAGSSAKVPINTFTGLLGQGRKTRLARRVKACTERFGKHISAIYRKALLCITKTTTRLTTNYQTLSLCQTGSIGQCTQGSSMQLTPAMRQGLWESHKTSAGSGTHQALGLLGIRSTTRKTRTSYARILRLFASVAGKSAYPQTLDETSIAQEAARLKRGEIAELITRFASVCGADRILRQTNTRRLNTVRVNAVESLGRQIVYCLTTETGSFSLANGVVVSNCDGMGYFIHRKFPVNKPIFITGIHSAM